MLTAMLFLLTLVLLLNCFPATKHDCNYHFVKKQKYVTINDGKIKGHLASDGDYLAFLGIPYARPPVGENRFKKPKPPRTWSGIFDAVRKVKCPQLGEGDEDCLILNVFTPKKPANNLLPVLFYIHGGSFYLDSGPTEGMEPLIKQNLIVVTINYRLGALGFLCLGIKDAPGNAGLKDQIAALEWVKKNIAFFGGDPNQVTIYGMSAGAGSVEHLVLSKSTKGLFIKAILESGSATSVWAIDTNPTKTARKMGKLLEIDDTTFVEILVKYYKNMDVDILTEANNRYYNNLTDGTLGFVPCIEKKLKNVNRVISDTAMDILQEGDFHRVPMMFMYASLEGLHLRSVEYSDNHYKERMERNFLDFLPADLIFTREKFRKETAKNVRRFYFGNSSDIGVIPYLQYIGDYTVMHGLLKSAEGHAAMNNSVYLMEFAYKNALEEQEAHFKEVDVAGHGDVTKYAFFTKQPHDEADKLTVRRIASLIANFVKHGNPTPTETALLPVTWPAVKPGNITYLYLDRTFQVGVNPYEDRIALWDKLYAKFRRPVMPVRPHF